MGETTRERALRLALVAALVMGFVCVSARQFTDGSCDSTRLGPMPATEQACDRVGGDWTPASGFIHAVYEIGHVEFWPVMIVVAMVAALAIIRLSQGSR